MSKWKDSPEILAGVFSNANTARQAISDLHAKGFFEDQIGLLIPPKNGEVDSVAAEVGPAVKHYLIDLAEGRTIVLVDAGQRYPDAAAILARFGADTRSQAIPDSGEVLPEHVRGKSP